MKAYARKNETGTYVSFFCPGCNSPHTVTVAGSKPLWVYNGDAEKPTFAPSVLVTAPPTGYRCHSFVTDGRIQYLSDCSHDFRGTTIDLPDYPDNWL